jgi:uncharacterized C2H2 Zn-finger protein
MPVEESKTPGYLKSILAMKCPRCRKGNMFNDQKTYRHISLSHIFNMPERCSECGQRFEMEPGFWYGTGYVSYALAVAISVSTFVAWVVLIGISTSDNRIFYWLILNAAILIGLQPYLMRLSRVIYIRFFVTYDRDFREHEPRRFE